MTWKQYDRLREEDEQRDDHISPTSYLGQKLAKGVGMSDKYILAEDGQTPVACDLMTWALWFERSKRIVAQDVIDGVKISTVFLGMDHSFGSGPPLLWETMIFGGEHNEYQERYSTFAEAVAGHALALSMVRGK